MFTGLIEATGEVVRVDPQGSGCRVRIAADVAAELTVGESVAVNGVCLTVTPTGLREFSADIGPETARVTTLGSLTPGRRVNLERPLRADGRVGGHFVQGHVDGVGTVEALRPEGECVWLTVSFPSHLAPYIVSKGSIALDGISLTVAGLHEACFDVQVIPYTWEQTSLVGAKASDRVNLECDLIGKYVARAVELGTLRA